MKTLLTIAEACTELGIGRTTLYDEMNAGRLEFVHVGSRRLIPGDAIPRYRDTLRVDRVERIVRLVAEDGTVDVDELPADATLAELREAKRRVLDRRAAPAAS